MLIPPNNHKIMASPNFTPPRIPNWEPIANKIFKKIEDTSLNIHTREVENILKKNAPLSGDKIQQDEYGIRMLSKLKIGQSAEKYIELEVDKVIKDEPHLYSYEDKEQAKNILCEIFIQDHIDHLYEALMPLTKELYFSLQKLS